MLLRKFVSWLKSKGADEFAAAIAIDIAIAAVAVVAAAIAIDIAIAAVAVAVAATAVAIAVVAAAIAAAAVANNNYERLGAFVIVFIGALLIFSFMNQPIIPIWSILIIIIALGELFFFFEKNKPEKNQSRFWFTAKRKILNLVESGILVGCALGFINLARMALPWIEESWDSIVYFLGQAVVWIGTGILIVAVIAIYIKLNSMKYKDDPAKKVIKKRRN